MKQIITNPLRAFTLAVSFLFAISLSAVEVEIDGINYEVVTKIKEATVIAKSSGKYTGKVVIPESVEYEGVSYAVTSIGDYAFEDCDYLTSVIIPNSVTSIGNVAFNWCIGLTSVTIGNSVTSIGEYAFSGCSGLTSVTIPNSVMSIGVDAFSFCDGLTSVHISDIAAWCKIDFGDSDSNPLYNAGHLFLEGEEIKDLVIPNNVTSIGSSAFSGCSGLTSVTIPNSVTSIRGAAFRYCSGLTSVTIPNSVTSIGNSAFSYCSGLTSVTIPNSVTSIEGSAFEGCSGLTSVTIPNSVTSIGSSAFRDCSGLTSVAIPNSVTSIGSSAFRDCSGLTSVAIPNSVTSIEFGTFDGCSGLTSVTIGNSVTSIGEYAFLDCSELTDVYCYAEQVPLTESYAFYGSYVEYATLHVPDASIEDYKATAPWSGFGTIVGLSGDMPVEPEIERCETPSVVYKDGKLTLTSATEGAEFITKVVADDAKTFYDAEIEFSASYSIEVFALKSGCENSDTVNVTLCWIDQDGADEENGIINVPSAPVLFQSNGGTLTLEGVPAGTEITVYSTSGTEIAKTIASGATTSLSVGLSNGSVVIVKIGSRSVKVRI